MQREQVIAILRAHQAELQQLGVRSLELFGSVARNEASATSDVDLLAEFKREFQLSNDSLQFRSNSILPLTRNLANSAIVSSTISRLLETTLLFRLKRANQ